MGEKRFDIFFSNEENSQNLEIKETLDYCKGYIIAYNGSNNGYFKAYKGGEVRIWDTELGEVVYSEEIY